MGARQHNSDIKVSRLHTDDNLALTVVPAEVSSHHDYHITSIIVMGSMSLVI